MFRMKCFLKEIYNSQMKIQNDYNDYVWVAKYETSSNNQSIGGAAVQVSQTRATMRDNARSIGNGWTITDIVTWSGLWTLFHIVFANRNSQSIMKGNYSGSVKATGLTTGAVASCVQIDDSAMSFYGIENLYGNVYEWIDGININARQAYVSAKISDFADTTTNYRQVGYVNHTSDSYIKQLGYDKNNKFAEFPIAIGGSKTTYYCSYYYQGSASYGVRVGSHWIENDTLGISYWNGYNTYTSVYSSTGSRLVYRPN